MTKLNNKGYLLVEIILAAGLAIGMAYFMTQITLKTKNRNDDLLVETLVSTDQGIIYNGIMKNVMDKGLELNDVYNKITFEGQKIKYGDKVITELTEYATFGNKIKDTTNNVIIIPITVKQLPDDNFDVIIYLN